ncbi:hypothetical protein [Burkholderia cenocepacia]|uniref:Uncharacterized protein n=1 Tax=Burkholderia cenocepacia TaxID=95486 RepID=A0A3S9NBI8_9BURK|nr:hypothetical protein [Burkholderia cenocepacia]AZQ53017.1 hypothetical protein D5R55_18635 [Burkholderia cenocepacia]
MVERGTPVMFVGDIFSPRETLRPGDLAHAHRRSPALQPLAIREHGRQIPFRCRLGPPLDLHEGNASISGNAGTGTAAAPPSRHQQFDEIGRRDPTEPTSDHRVALGRSGAPPLMR